MKEMKILSGDRLGYNFISPADLPPNKDEYYLRNVQLAKLRNYWRHLLSTEIETLVKNANSCTNWDDFLVHDPFSPELIRNNNFFGLVRIDTLEKVVLEYHFLKLPAGITNSTVIACDIGKNAAIHNVSYLAHYIIGKNVVLMNIDEMQTTHQAKFGNGILRDGETGDMETIDLINETGSRAILPFDGILPADAYLWARFRGDTQFISGLQNLTQNQCHSAPGYYGTVGDGTVIKGTRFVKDVNFGPHSYVKGANKLKNLTIKSSWEESTQIGEGIELVNGIVGYGCRIFYGCKAVRFIMGDHSNLKYGARLIHSFLGDNSTISCCEMLNNLIFPAHEQHHNNSFLIATLLKGQSNMAAGATIGSNHNSRANDGEIHAGRGFWPGLATTLKHNCKVASFVLFQKGAYPAELNIPFPFSLIINDTRLDRLVIIPTFWWLNNMYALVRNSWKFKNRDNRLQKRQNIEFDYLAPDTIEEILQAMALIEEAVGKTVLRHQNSVEIKTDNIREIGKQLLLTAPEKLKGLEVECEGIENSRRKVILIKTHASYLAYRDMLIYYAARNLLEFLTQNLTVEPADLNRRFKKQRVSEWENLGGQLVAMSAVRKIMENVKSGTYRNWDDIHTEYEKLWAAYPMEKMQHSFAVLLMIYETTELTEKMVVETLTRFIEIQHHICEQVYQTRKKDEINPFRQMVFDTAEEMQEVLGSTEENSFVQMVNHESQNLIRAAEAAIERYSPQKQK